MIQYSGGNGSLKTDEESVLELQMINGKFEELDHRLKVLAERVLIS